MAEHYVEDYMISLGFDLDSEQGKKFLAMQKEIDKQSKQSEQDAQKSDKSAQTRDKNSKVRVNQSKQELNTIAELQKSFKQIENIWSRVGEGDVFGAFASGITGAKAFKSLLDNIQGFTFKGIGKVGLPKSETTEKSEQFKGTNTSTKAKKDFALFEIENAILSAKNLIVTSSEKTPQSTSEPRDVNSQTSLAPINNKTVDSSKKAFDGLGKSVLNSAKNMSQLKNIATKLFGSGAEATGLGAEATEAAGSLAAIGSSAIAATGGIALIAIAAAAAVVAAYNIADGASTASTNIESMAAQMWITDGAAWQLSNTLSAMGKTTADLSTIALNPTLNKQFQTLQAYQKTQLQLPADFKATGDAWAQSVQTPMEEIKLTNQYMGEMVGYDFEKSLTGPAERFASAIQGIQSGIMEIVEAFDSMGKDIESSSFYKAIENINSTMGTLWQRAKQDFGALGAVSTSANSQNNAAGSSKASTPTTSSNQVYNVPNYAASLAPNSPSNSSTSNSKVEVNNNPNINVYTNSSDPQTVAQSTAAAVTQANNSAALIKTIQGVTLR